MAGVALTFASHVSGILALVPVAYAAHRRRRTRWRALVALAIGAAIAGAIYAKVTTSKQGESFASGHLDIFLSVFQAPSRFPQLLQGCLAEVTLYSAPASVFVPAGLWVLWRTQPHLAVVSVLWLLAWPASAFFISDRLLGAYYVPTYAVQVLLAALAISRVPHRFVPGAIAVLLATLPSVLLLLTASELGALIAVIAGALLLPLLLQRDSESPTNLRLLAVLALATLLLSAVDRIPHFRDDPGRDQIAATLVHVTNDDDLVVIIEPNHYLNYTWLRFFPNAETRVINPFVAQLTAPDQQPQLLASYEKRIKEASLQGRGVWVSGEVDRFLGSRKCRRNPVA